MAQQKDKEFEDMVKANPAIFDDMDCRPGDASGYTEAEADSITPEWMKEEMRRFRAKKRAAQEPSE